MRTENALCTLLLASSVGVAIGLLFAPDKGSQTRKKIKERAENFLEDEVITYNRILCDVKTKLDELFKGLLIQPNKSERNWADMDQKDEIIT